MTAGGKDRTTGPPTRSLAVLVNMLCALSAVSLVTLWQIGEKKIVNLKVKDI